MGVKVIIYCNFIPKPAHTKSFPEQLCNKTLMVKLELKFRTVFIM